MSKLVFETLSNNIYRDQLLPIQCRMETQMNNIFCGYQSIIYSLFQE